MAVNTFTFKLDDEQRERTVAHLRTGNYLPIDVAYTDIAVKGDQCSISLYTSGKLVVQGRGAADWVSFALEPLILLKVITQYDEVLNPSFSEAHMGVDESGKGDYFGPLVIASAYTDRDIAAEFKKLEVRDSKSIKNDRRIHEKASAIRRVLGDRFKIVTIGPEAYNRLYASMGNVNRILAWGHARAIENLLDVVPKCSRAVSDQFGPKHRIERALLQKGKKIKLEQRPKAEDDPAVAAASILARSAFVSSLEKMTRECGIEIPKGASSRVREAAQELVKTKGSDSLQRYVKLHFRTTEQVLAENAD